MFIKKQNKKPKESTFAQNVTAFTEMVSVGGRLALTITCLAVILIIRDGLSGAFTSNFVIFAFLIFVSLIILAMYGLYKLGLRIVEAAEDVAASWAEAAKATKEAAKFEKDKEDVKVNGRLIEMQGATIKSAFGAMAQIPLANRASGKSGGIQPLRREDITLELEDTTTAKKRKSAFVIK